LARRRGGGGLVEWQLRLRRFDFWWASTGQGAILADPSGEQGLRTVLNPLVEQRRNFPTKIGRMI
jgi:hypothetical protein